MIKKGVGRDGTRLKEIGGVISIALAAFIFLCLFSYDPHDPSLTHYVAGKVKIINYGGLVGAYLSDALLRVFGITAYLFSCSACPLLLQTLSRRTFAVSLLSLPVLRDS